ncbi:MFS transporter [Microbacterium lushaniae]|nr:MFS transporter [Microbacterium lushaniae]KAA9149402.1 MFS transporter [Microbacterium lushaniae]
MRGHARAPEAHVLFWQLIARFPMGMMTLGVLMWGEQHFASYAFGGLLVATFTLGFAAGSYLSTRLFRFFRSACVLRVDVVLSASGMLMLVFLPNDIVTALVLTALTGLTFPPVTPLARALYPRLSQGPRLMRVYSLDAIAQEGIWILAPIFAIGIAGALSPSHVIVLSAVFVLAGTVQFSRLPVLTHYGQPPLPADTNSRSPAVPRIVIGFFVIGFFLVASGAFIEVYVVEQFGYEGVLAGVLLALIAVGSVAGGLTFARRPVTRYSLAARLLIVATGLSVAAAAPWFWLLVVGVFLSGAGIAPSFTAMHARIAVVAPSPRAAEVYAFANTAQLVGLAAGSAVAGVIVDVAPAGYSLAAGAGCVIVAVGVALILGRKDEG